MRQPWLLCPVSIISTCSARRRPTPAGREKHSSILFFSWASLSSRFDSPSPMVWPAARFIWMIQSHVDGGEIIWSGVEWILKRRLRRGPPWVDIFDVTSYETPAQVPNTADSIQSQGVCWPRRDDTSYELLPPSNSEWHDGSGNSGLHRRRKSGALQISFSRRLIASSLLALLFLIVLYRVWPRTSNSPSQPVSDPPEDPPNSDEIIQHEDPALPSRPPPLYEEYRERERTLPQHNLSLPYPEGATAKFLWAANHGSAFGWGNYMQEMLLNAYLAYASHRAYVFDNYTWAREGPEISSWNGKPIPARIPLSAIISGPIIGGSMRDKEVPRAVSREYFFKVCPESERVVLDTRTIQDTLDPDATVTQIVEKWAAELDSIASHCVELARHSPALFSYTITNTIRVLDAFPALSRSPILSDLGWSPLILEGFNSNLQFFTSPSDFDPSFPAMTHITPLKGLLVLHIRRGDYETWCPDGAYRNAMSYTGFNSFPVLPDKFSPLKENGSEQTEGETLRHCLPTFTQIVEKVLSVNEPHITRVYVMSNAPRPWLAELAAALRAAHRWTGGVGTSRDLELSWEAKFVSEAVDMHVAQRAEKFVGNGFSSLTSNVVLLRMHNPDLNPKNTHFW